LSGPGCRCTSDCTCGACRGFRDATPLLVANRPGLPAVRSRVGDHARFRASLLTALSRARHPALRGLTSRSDDDFSVALLDAFAVLGDVFTFYQERIANESFLRTAHERLSIGAIARLVGYELRPGSAANVALAFQMMEAPGLPKGSPGIIRSLDLPVGTRVQSTPGQDELPQTFETVEALELRPDWNGMAAATLRAQELRADLGALVLTGSALNLRAGDGLLLVFPTAPGAGECAAVYRLVERVEVDARADQTRVLFQDDAATAASAVFGALAAAQRGVFAFRRQASLFGHNAPDFGILDLGMNGALAGTAWDDGSGADWNVARSANDAAEGELMLDTVYRDVVPRGWGVWDKPGGAGSAPVIVKVTPRGERGFSGFGLSGRGTRIRVEKDTGDADGLAPETFAELRTITVMVQSEKLRLALVPMDAPVKGASIGLAVGVEALEAGRRLAVSGQRLRAEVRKAVTLTIATAQGPVAETLEPGARIDLTAFPVEEDSGDITYVAVRDGAPATVTAPPDAMVRADEPASELAVLASLDDDGRGLELAGPLAWSYDPPTVRVNANVARATHGETVREAFEGGDTRVPFQRFALKQPPVTYVSAVTPTGTASTLRVWVDEVEWREAPFLYGHGPTDRVFVARTDGEGRASIQFGDGVTGARLPTGARNVRAEYRRGLGAAGNLDAGQINLLMSRPLGLKDAANPLPSADGKDAEADEDARANAPLTVLTLDRVVSLQDFEDFARAFAGIAKAAAAWSWFGETRGVFLTVAGADGGPVSAATRKTLQDAIAAWGDPHVPVAVENHAAVTFRTGVRVEVDADHRAVLVLAAVEAALRAAFAFRARAFGQDVSAAEVMAVAQGVRGVVAVQVTSLHRSGDADPEAGLAVPLVAGAPLPGARGAIQPGELLTLDAAPLERLEEMA
jgi:hypothetical protein